MSATDCPDAAICQTCPCASEDDVCFPGERLRAERDEAIAERDAAREALGERQAAIDRALSQLQGSAYVGGPTEREAFRAAVEALGPFRTEHCGQSLTDGQET